MICTFSIKSVLLSLEVAKDLDMSSTVDKDRALTLLKKAMKVL
jgi:hypothetical protein